MCGRYGLDGKRIDLDREFAAQVRADLAPRYNIAPCTPVLVVKETPQGRIGTFHRWGLVPSWAKDPGIGARLINARAETVAEKPSFRHAFQRRRCLVPASGFYEWRVQEQGGKQPYWIHGQDGGFLAFAGLWETWLGPHGEEVDSCTILTTEANDLMAPIHPRMPVILGKADYSVWLDGSKQNLAEVSKLLRPCPASWIKAYPVGAAVGKVRNEGHGLIEPIST